MRTASIALLCCSLFVAGFAFADEQERVTQRVQGELVEKIPGEKVVLKLATGEVRVIPWSEIVPNEPQASAPPTAPVVAPLALAPPPASSGATAEIIGDKPGVVLQRLAGQGAGVVFTTRGSTAVSVDTYEMLCAAPCTANVEQGQLYRVAGEGVTPSATFGLPAGHSALSVNAESAGARYGGFLMTIFGSSMLGGGALVLGLEFSGTLLGLGAIFLLIGIPLIVTSGTTVTTNGVELATRSRQKVRHASGIGVLMRTTVFSLAMFIALTRPALAWEPERIAMRNGGVVRRDLVEKVPNDHVTLKLATGEIRVIPWQEIGEPPQPAATVQQTTPPPQPKVGPPALSPEHDVHLAFSTDVPSRVESLDTGGRAADADRARRLMDSGARFVSMCEGPCDTTVSSDGEYRVSAGTTHYGKTFRLESGDARVDLRAAETGGTRPAP